MKLPLSIIAALLIVVGLYVNSAGINNTNELFTSLGFDTPIESTTEPVSESDDEWLDRDFGVMKKPLSVSYSDWKLGVNDGADGLRGINTYSHRAAYLKRGTNVVSICHMKGPKVIDPDGNPVGGYAPTEVELFGNCSFLGTDENGYLVTAIHNWDGNL